MVNACKQLAGGRRHQNGDFHGSSHCTRHIHVSDNHIGSGHHSTHDSNRARHSGRLSPGYNGTGRRWRSCSVLVDYPDCAHRGSSVLVLLATEEEGSVIRAADPKEMSAIPIEVAVQLQAIFAEIARI